jgi:protocatechuate 3,4-dioxygenase beta subunit
MRRRRFVQAGLALPAALALLQPTLAPAQAALALTPECKGKAAPTLRQTEGPFYSPNTPRKDSLVEPGSRAQRIVVAGLVLTPDCKPVGKAMLDFWHADEKGEYDNAGFRYRGHLFADAQGRYRVETIAPALYPGRARHIHVKVGAPGRSPLTTQLYFPGDPGNPRDGIYRPELQMKREGDAWRFDFVIEM